MRTYRRPCPSALGFGTGSPGSCDSTPTSTNSDTIPSKGCSPLPLEEGAVGWAGLPSPSPVSCGHLARHRRRVHFSGRDHNMGSSRHRCFFKPLDCKYLSSHGEPISWALLMSPLTTSQERVSRCYLLPQPRTALCISHPKTLEEDGFSPAGNDHPSFHSRSHQ